MRTFQALLFVSACCFGSLSVAEDSPTAVDLFEAANTGRVEIKFIAMDESRANVLVKNLTDLPLVIQLPEAIAAVPVLAQFGQGLGQGNGQGNAQAGGQNGGGNQPVGGNVNGGQGQGVGMNAGNGAQGLGLGFMRIPPQKQLKLVALTVCLEHGKAEPNPRVAYRMVPLSEYTDNPKVAKLCREVGSSHLSQNTAQALAWHLANRMSWDELATVNSIESKYLGNVPYFQKRDIELAKAWIKAAAKEQPIQLTSSNDGSKACE